MKLSKINLPKNKIPFIIASIFLAIGLTYQNCGPHQQSVVEPQNDVLSGIYIAEGKLPAEVKKSDSKEVSPESADESVQKEEAKDSTKDEPVKEEKGEESRDGSAITNPSTSRKINPCRMDTNGNGVIDKQDQGLLYQMMQGMMTMQQVQQFDINNDGTLNQTDLAYYPSHVGEICQKFKLVIAGFFSTCGISRTDKVYCWGSHQYGQLGNGALANQVLPAEINMSLVGEPNNFKTISSGMGYYCGVHNNNKIYCWGNNTLGQLGNGTNINQSTPVEINMSGTGLSNSFSSVSAGIEVDDSIFNHHTCATHTTGTALCWGNNDFAQLGNGNTTSSNIPVIVDATQFSSPSLIAISAGSRHTCAIDANNKLYCWGANPYGQLGNGNTVDQQNPVEIDTTYVAGATNNFKKISVGNSHTCAVHNDNKSYCWGMGNWSALGSGDIVNIHSPMEVAFTSAGFANQIKEISAGVMSTCAIDLNNNGYCWGTNNWGQLGIGIIGMPRVLPHEIVMNPVGPATFKQISSAIGFHSCGIHTNKKTYCWSYNDNGEIGMGDDLTFHDDSPQEVDVTNVQ